MTLLTNFALLLTIAVCCNCKSVSLASFLNAVSLRAENLTISLSDVELRGGILSFNGVTLEGNGVHYSGAKHTEPQRDQGKRTVHFPDLANSIDRSIDPCQDFYSFVCNGWIRSHPIPQNHYQYTQTELLKERLNKQIKAILSAPALLPTREDILMRTFYKKCVQNAYSESTEGFRLLFAKTRELHQVSSITDWLLIMKTEQLFHELTVSADEYNSTRNTLQIVPAQPMLSAQIYFDPAYTQEFLATRDVLFRMLAIIAGEDHRMEFISRNLLEHVRRVESLIRVDQTIAKINEETEFNTDSVAVTVGELRHTLRSIDWIRYISAFIPRHLQYSLAKRQVRISQILTVKRMEELLLNMDDQTLEDYLDWKVIFHFSDFLGEKFQLLMEEFSSQVYGVKGRDRTDECVTVTMGMFHDVVGKHYLQRHFNFDSVFGAKELVEDVRNAFLDMLNENEWMDEKTKKRARQKRKKRAKCCAVNKNQADSFHANAIRDVIAYDNSIFNETMRKEKYAKLSFNSQNSYYEIVTTMELWMQDKAFLKLETLNTRDSFDTPVTEVNAFYDGSQNQIAIMAGMLQSPFFNASLPRLLNYGAIGVVAGHEITHGFDDNGASYDEAGNKNNWWDEHTYKNFEWKKQCFDEQYGSIVVKDLHVRINGRRTEGENIADNGGMRAAIRAADRLSARVSEHFTIVGLEDFTQMQYFFMNYAFVWCGSTRRATLLNKLATDAHPPDMYRVNVVLSNQPEFAKAFECHPGSPMHPENTCTLW
ncbi:hypothetical protein Y032_0161g3365 [Ancylostoma ceylanicum]|uniref:Peptidase family M13 n=1 Tax=Ancylostoma ceylanicum TaxID=53326 RepID=A0A016SXV4_9BILA|nr:hypothetical protein Y032_0161g3365 [Ancylostoma ceylanicum]